jgi:predicted DNA-binding transcriptional regulator AlpA
MSEVTTGAAPLPAMLTARMIRERVLPIGRRTLFRWIAGGQFPEADLRVCGKVFWRRETVLAWLESHTGARAQR